MKLPGFYIRCLAVFALVLFISGCASVDYVGDTYAPTDHADMYFDAKDIPRPYKVMGQMTLDEQEYASSQAMQADMKKEAMARGADAVLFTGMQKIQTGVVTHWQEPVKNKGKNKYDFGTSTSQIQHEKEMTGSLLKYTDIAPSQGTGPS
ncbi:MAG: hypothetical protein WC133_01440 [Candidatus Omnitrophota bacterium]